MTRKMPPQDDDFVMTIASDEELSDVEASSDEEEETKQAILSKQQAAKQKKQQQKQKQAQTLAGDFEFDEAERFGVNSAGCSWDFTKAISRIEQLEKDPMALSTAAKKTSIQMKIEKKRKEKASLKKKKKVKKPEPEEAEEELQQAEEEEEEEEDEDEEEDEALSKATAGTEEQEDESNDESDENDGEEEQEHAEEGEQEEEEEDGEEEEEEEEEEEDEQEVVEETRLQEALEEAKQQRTQDETDQEDPEERKKAKAFFEEDPFVAEAASKVHTFADLKLSRPLMRAITSLNFEKPTPIQQRAIPVALTGKDICASAQTGSGKTAAFLLPILERLQFRSRRMQATRVLIICPVRELATQCQSMLEQLARFTDITSCLVVGGLPLKAQEVELRNCPDVVICTPGRMIDHLRNSHAVHMEDLEILVLDEADRLLELGFTEEVQELVRMCPKARQTMLFSATMTSKVDQLIDLSMKRPVRISTDPLFDMATHLVQEFVRIRPNREADREAILLALCTRTFRTNTIVFMETKHHAHRMMIIFGLAGLKAAELHGNLAQKERLEALQNFREGKVDLLLCTDIAARGIDVQGVHAVINYEMPKDITTYVHRVGRTARAGRNGRAVTLTSESRRLVMKQISRHCRGFVKSRAVPDAVISQWNARIEAMASDVSSILDEEKLEKKMQMAEREATRTKNLLVHQDEITSRPARTWFMTAKEKKALQEQSKVTGKRGLPEQQTLEEEEANVPEDPKAKAKKIKSMNHKKRRLHEIREQEQKRLQEARQHDHDDDDDDKKDDKPNKKNKVFTADHVAAAARQAKKQQWQQMRAQEEESISELAARKRMEKMHKQQAANNTKRSRKTGGDVFDQDLDARGGKFNTSAKRSGAADKSGADHGKYVFKEKITEYKKHAKKSTNSFKSKGRYRRRK